jgi:hypothetical protein
MTEVNTSRQDRNRKNKDKKGKIYGSQKHVRQQIEVRELKNKTVSPKKKKGKKS